MSYSPAELERLAELLEAKANVAEAKAAEYRCQLNLFSDTDPAHQQDQRARNARHYANVCRYFAEKHTPKAERLVSKETVAFSQFWAAYPRKVGRPEAIHAWHKNGCESIASTILKAVAQAVKCEQWTKDRGSFIPHASTWLNRQGWTDDYGPVTTKRTTERQDPPGWRDWLRINGRQYAAYSCTPWAHGEFNKWTEVKK